MCKYPAGNRYYWQHDFCINLVVSPFKKVKCRVLQTELSVISKHVWPGNLCYLSKSDAVQICMTYYVSTHVGVRTVQLEKLELSI